MPGLEHPIDTLPDHALLQRRVFDQGVRHVVGDYGIAHPGRWSDSHPIDDPAHRGMSCGDFRCAPLDGYRWRLTGELDGVSLERESAGKVSKAEPLVAPQGMG